MSPVQPLVPRVWGAPPSSLGALRGVGYLYATRNEDGRWDVYRDGGTVFTVDCDYDTAVKWMYTEKGWQW